MNKIWYHWVRCISILVNNALLWTIIRMGYTWVLNPSCLWQSPNKGGLGQTYFKIVAKAKNSSCLFGVTNFVATLIHINHFVNLEFETDIQLSSFHAPLTKN